MAMAPQAPDPLEAQIDQWRSFLRRRQAIRAQDVAELEDHLRDQVAELRAAGLDADEAFLVAVKRMGALDTISNEFAREHSDRLWKQLVVAPVHAESSAGERREFLVVLALAVIAAILIQLPKLFGIQWGDADAPFWLRNAPFFVLPLLAGYFAWKRGVGLATWMILAAGFVAAALVANVHSYPKANSDTQKLAILHMPIAVWLLVGVAYAGKRWREVAGRMDFVRFSGELLIYYALIALGGGVLIAFTIGMFEAIGLKAERFVEQWVLPCGAIGAVMIASWLVEAKKSVVENMAPVLTRVFTPLFTIALLAFLAAMLWTGRGIDIERNALIVFDLLLVLVLGLLLYSISARDPLEPPGPFDRLLVLLLASALVADAFALAAIAGRISDFGSTPNRVAVLGFNAILLVNLAWSAVLYVRFLRGRGTFAVLERWQTTYLPVFPAWAAIVVLVFPPLFGFK
ncbi:MAG TPA: permease prefix domain 1-containing protein [Usitatibacter sp.]|nr:permease prefix domain 1-containing protein [Usitatibacter sp.]